MACCCASMLVMAGRPESMLKHPTAFELQKLSDELQSHIKTEQNLVGYTKAKLRVISGKRRTSDMGVYAGFGPEGGRPIGTQE